MNKEDALICQRCGGKINRSTYICEYCGTAYKCNDNYLKIVNIRPGVRVLGASRKITDEMFSMYGAKELSEIVIKELAQEMSDALIPCMDVKLIDSPLDRSKILNARLRVLDRTATF